MHRQNCQLGKKVVVGLVSLYTSLSTQDISSIAKSIKRSPHRVRQAIESLVKKLTKTKNYIGKFALGISILSMVASLGEKVTRLGNIAKIIAECVVETMTSFIKWALTKAAKALFKLIPTIGVILSFFADSIVSVIFKIAFTNKKIKLIKTKITSVIEVSSYSLYDYFKVFLNE